MTSVCVVMPAYNEAEGITSFLFEISQAISDLTHSFVVVDDCSSDETKQVLEVLANNGFPVAVYRNESNSGHGPSTLKALQRGLELGTDIVVAVDGDGQFLGPDIRRLIEVMSAGQLDVVEGCREARGEPFYRKVVSNSTRVLVWSRARVWPMDANTPLRAYRRQALKTLLELLPSGTMTPNLFASMIVRRRRMRIAQVPVTSIPRRGRNTVGSSWGRGTFLPSRRFVSFCAAAAVEWASTSVR